MKPLLILFLLARVARIVSPWSSETLHVQIAYELKSYLPRQTVLLVTRRQRVSYLVIYGAIHLSIITQIESAEVDHSVLR